MQNVNYALKKLRCFVTVLSPVYTGLQSTATVTNHSVPFRIHVARFISNHFSHEFAHLVLVMVSNKDQRKLNLSMAMPCKARGNVDFKDGV